MSDALPPHPSETKGDQASADAIKNWSQVNPLHRFKTLSRVWQIMAVLLVLGIMMLILFSGHSSAQSDPVMDAITQSPSANAIRADLSANLAQLHRQLYRPAAQEAPPRQRSGFSLGLSASAKEYQVRQAAPTAMYRATPNHETLTGTSQQTDTTSGGVHRLRHRDTTVVAGEFIPAVLETAIDSSLPGMVRAVTSQDVYAYWGDRLLIPAGSRLIGHYTEATIQGQRRVKVTWERLILADGLSVSINSLSTDALGRSGQAAGAWNSHFGARLAQALLLSLIGAGVDTVGVSGSDSDNSAAEYRMGVASALQSSAQSSVQGTVANSPTLYVRQGARINVLVAEDLDFYTVMQAG